MAQRGRHLCVFRRGADHRTCGIGRYCGSVSHRRWLSNCPETSEPSQFNGSFLLFPASFVSKSEGGTYSPFSSRLKLVSRCLQPSQPQSCQRIILLLKTSLNLSPTYSTHREGERRDPECLRVMCSLILFFVMPSTFCELRKVVKL